MGTLFVAIKRGVKFSKDIDIWPLIFFVLYDIFYNLGYFWKIHFCTYVYIYAYTHIHINIYVSRLYLMPISHICYMRFCLAWIRRKSLARDQFDSWRDIAGCLNKRYFCYKQGTSSALLNAILNSHRKLTVSAIGIILILHILVYTCK